MKVLAEQDINGATLRVVQGDITLRDVDAIVNAANEHLQHGGGVAGAIVRAGGTIIQRESDEIGFVPVGTAAITTGGELAAKYVIHTVGPRMGEGDEDEKLKSAVLSALALADGNGLKSISMPAISSGIFGYPKDKCAKVLVSVARDYLRGGERSLQLVEFCVYGDDSAKHFVHEMESQSR